MISCNAQNKDSNPNTADIDQAVKASNEWVEIVDLRKYELSWETSSQLFKNAVSKENWVNTLGSVRTPLGKMISRELETNEYKTSLPGAPDGEYVVIVYKTEFENKSNSFETVTPMKDNDGKWRVSGYYIK
jgi:hypothetical protein